jgi:hypothetical protein
MKTRTLACIAALIALFFLPACTVHTYGTTTRIIERPAPWPSYIHYYADGSCWADDVWYGTCPWFAGPYAGYYVYRSGSYWYDPHVYWETRIHHPPPRVWVRRHVHAPPHWRYRPVPRHRHPARPSPRRR